MALDPVIAGGYRGVEIPNALQQYAQVTGIQNAMQEQRMRALQMRQLEEESASRNQLRSLNPEAPDYEAQLMRVNPQLGMTYRKERVAAETADVKGREARLKYWQALVRNAATDPSDTVLQRLAVEAVRLRVADENEATSTLQTMLQLPLEKRRELLAQSGAAPVTPKTLTLPERYVPVGKLVFDRKTQQWITPPQLEAPATRGAASSAKVPTAPALPKAPTGYRYTATGDLEPIPGGPVAAKLGAAEAKTQQGADQATQILDTLQSAYENLSTLNAIPSEKQGLMANAIASIAATGPGQVAGRVAGTKAQTERDVIQSARNQLLAAVKSATGMSAQQLNSNVEFKTWLDSLTDPAKSLEANQIILENMRKFIASGGKYSAKKGGGAVTTEPTAGAAMYARNPKTGERIVSNDGGNTWAPVR